MRLVSFRKRLSVHTIARRAGRTVALLKYKGKMTVKNEKKHGCMVT